MTGSGISKGSLAVRPGYEVGYAKPPETGRFQKGQSGNPRGRPKGAKNKLPRLNEERMKQIVLEEAYRTIAVRDGERTITVPMAQAIVRALAVNAVKGQHRAQRLFTELLFTTESANKALADQYLEAAMTYKLDWDRELTRREQLNITHLPDPLPHPDHIIINMNLGTVEIKGPMTKEEKALLDHWRDRKSIYHHRIHMLREGAASETDPALLAEMQAEIRGFERLVERIEETFSG